MKNRKKIIESNGFYVHDIKPSLLRDNPGLLISILLVVTILSIVFFIKLIFFRLKTDTLDNSNLIMLLLLSLTSVLIIWYTTEKIYVSIERIWIKNLKKIESNIYNSIDELTKKIQEDGVKLTFFKSTNVKAGSVRNFLFDFYEPEDIILGIKRNDFINKNDDKIMQLFEGELKEKIISFFEERIKKDNTSLHILNKKLNSFYKMVQELEFNFDEVESN